jgi:hypothetical protein
MSRIWVGTVAALVAGVACAEEVVWTSPSNDAYGTMPLGNGEVTLNAWIDAHGDLRFYIARIDAIDEQGELLKVGAMRLRVGGADVARTAVFTQRLDTATGVLEAAYGTGDARVSLRLWVDAERPVIVAEAECARPQPATLHSEIWRDTVRALSEECSTINKDSPYDHRKPDVPVDRSMALDTVLDGPDDAIGWFHRNPHSAPYQQSAKLQGLDAFPRPDPILHRTFGALARGVNARREDAKTLRAPDATRHVFEIAAVMQHPATEAAWRAEAVRVLDAARAVSLDARRAGTVQGWRDFDARSWVRIATDKTAQPSAPADPVPANKHPLAVGIDQGGGSRFSGQFGRVALYAGPSDEKAAAALAACPRDAKAERAALIAETAPEPGKIEGTQKTAFTDGFTAEAWVRPEGLGRYQRLVDKTTPGVNDGFLFDITPQGGLRAIIGGRTATTGPVLKTGEWRHVALSAKPSGDLTLYLDGKVLWDGNETVDEAGDNALVVSRAYALQRFVTACAGRGALPIKFNGSLFTVPEKGKEKYDADYRRWGPGYWFQNTRLPYLSMAAAGDFDLLQPFFKMYFDLLPLCKFRTKLYLGHGGAYYPECIYFWGDVFPETYGWTPSEERKDKLQVSGYHKYEWVGGLEIARMMLEYAEYTGDTAFLREKAAPFTTEILAFFDQHYAVGAGGRLVMHPSQALETWWDCTNPMPELAGLHGVIGDFERVTARETALRPAFLAALKAKLPPIPTVASPGGRPMLAPAEKFTNNRNCENPELYAVYPFRVFAYDRPDVEWAREALKHRKNRNAFGWSQDDLFYTYLGDAEEARDFLVKRARRKHGASRFPVFWGPNFDWVPDQDHGGVLTRAVQTLAMQCDGKRIDLFPAWPSGWDVDFKLHAPLQTTVEATLRGGKVTRLVVTPETRRGDVRIRSNGEWQTAPAR